MTNLLPILFPELSTVDNLSRKSKASFDVDVSVDGDNYILEAALPGYNKSDIKISTENGILSISAQKEIDKKDYIFSEMPKVSTVERSFKLAEDIDQDNISANIKDGMLTLTLPKQEKKKAKEIKIK